MNQQTNNELRKEWINYCLEREVNISQCADWWLDKFRSLFASEHKRFAEEIKAKLEKMYWCKEHQAYCDHAFDFCALTDLILSLRENKNND